jgi:hypothetical protein
MVALHQTGQGIQKRFWPVERIHMQPRLVISALIVRVKHYRRDVKVLSFRADAATLQYWHRVSNHNGADVADAKNSESSFDRRHWYDPVSGMR